MSAGKNRAMAKIDNKQAWVRFVLGVIALVGTVWGASSEFKGVAIVAANNASAIVEIQKQQRSFVEDIHDLELQDKETMIRQQQILSELSDIKTILRSFEVVK